jgi:hypothetical protein
MERETTASTSPPPDKMQTPRAAASWLQSHLQRKIETSADFLGCRGAESNHGGAKTKSGPHMHI